ncbi:MAG: polyprenol monophosphomannose synthase [Actinobacteria bacterium]|nr:polyprenol monophosphomannose synthase [Actinomycetota bacterium]
MELSANSLLLIPTYNEALNIRTLIKEIRSTFPALQILVIDDNSSDGTAEMINQLKVRDNKIELLSRPEKTGLGNAYRAGFAWGMARSFEYFIEMDADHSHRVSDLKKLLAQADKYDLTIGSRWVKGGQIIGWAKHREILSRFGSGYSRILLGLKVRDCTSGFRVFARSTVESIDFNNIQSNGYGFQVETLYRANEVGLSIGEVPITFVERREGVSKMHSGIVFEAMWNVSKFGFFRLLSKFKFK